ncbi:homoserine kinase [Acidianus sp. RZ1]|uniref:homoserine kinase n=1 Tax=Acidianus sp. RZ1 TaxID=1540082 RepID=UPI001490E53D|nr:homoserine kinase [Acidianus sp. RZ1]NON63257.1 homoserine kinase [Acidianus sp. RZ1]
MSILSRAFSSSANLGSGFDILSVAHNAFFDEVIAETSEKKGVTIESNSGVPLSVEENSAGYAVKTLLEELELKEGIKLKIRKGIPYSLGLGSSGASAAAAVASVNELLELGLSKENLVKYAMAGEIASSGSPHPDNVAASIFGGVVAVTSTNPISVIEVPANIHVKFLLVIPSVKVEEKTKKAREMLPREIPLKSYVSNSRYLSSLLLGFFKGDRNLIRQGLNDDIVEKSREPLFPHYRKIKDIALKLDAVGSCVSGAGPSILVAYDEKTRIDEIEKKSIDICKEFNLQCTLKRAEIAGGVNVERRN